MVLTNAGRIALRMGELNFAFTDGYSEPLPNIVLHENVIMPNHVYGIVQILGYGRCRGEKCFALRAFQCMSNDYPNVHPNG